MVSQNFLSYSSILLSFLYLANAYQEGFSIISINYLKQEFNPENLKWNVFPEQCWNQLITEHWLDFKCLKLVMSKMIGYAIIALAAIAKLPQIIKIVKAGDVQGLSFSSQYLETITYAFALSYNLHKSNPFSTFGEIPFLIFQNLTIFILFAVYDKKLRKYQFILFMIIFFLILIIFLLQLVPEIIYTFSIISTIILNLFTRIPQILLSFKEKSTGQLSFITSFVYFGGACARLLTLLIETNDKLYTYTQFQSCILLGIIIFQILFYWNSTNAKLKKVEGKTD